MTLPVSKLITSKDLFELYGNPVDSFPNLICPDVFEGVPRPSVITEALLVLPTYIEDKPTCLISRLLNGAVVPTPTLPSTPRSLKSLINPTVRVEAIISSTVISGLPVSVCAVVAVPVTSPVNGPIN